MLNFEYHNPTKIVFGKNQLEKLPAYIQSCTNAKKILVAFGGGSAEKIGLLTQIRTVLSDLTLVEFGGIEANPEYETLMQAVEVCKREKIDFILAVGGGSVIDGVKFISGAAKYAGDPWKILTRETDDVFTEAIPFGTVLTIPATGSEANSGAVISRQELKEKRAMGGPLFFPVFSFIDPSLLASLPQKQVANGIVDSFMHTLEQYLTHPTDNYLQEREAEAILLTLIEIAPKVMKNPADYVLASNLFRCATHALNGNLRCGVPTDWATHSIGHELTALHGIDHARTLSIIIPRLWEEMFAEKKEKLAQYGQRVWNLSGDDVAKQAIAKTEEFLRSLGIKTKLSEYPIDASQSASIIRKRFEERQWLQLGENKSITPEIIERIVSKAI